MDATCPLLWPAERQSLLFLGAEPTPPVNPECFPGLHGNSWCSVLNLWPKPLNAFLSGHKYMYSEQPGSVSLILKCVFGPLWVI